jgi:ribosomal protein L7Ae-like RNA K-turn-binding protein
LREVLHGVKARRCILVVVSPNIENAEALDERVGEIIARCRGADHVKPVPVVFAGNRRSLGRALGKSVSVSAVGVFSADGAHETLKPALALAAKLRDVWAAAVRAELAQRRPFLCRACAKPVTAFVRVDCLRCAATACETCQAKQLTCPASGEPCSLVRIARLPPVFRLSAAAPEFVPKAL